MKEIKKKHSSRPVGRVEMGSQAERTLGKGKVVAGRPSEVAAGGLSSPSSFICMQINQEEQRGSKVDHTTQGSSTGK